jgi:hypothetical protein
MNHLFGPHRLAIHQVGHAVEQAFVGRDLFSVDHINLGGEPIFDWRSPCASGETVLDRESLLNIYAFGLVILSGVTTEERYLNTRPPECEPLVAIIGLNEWQEKARGVVADSGKIRLRNLNVMSKLREWFAEMAIWQGVASLAAELLDRGTLDGPHLRQIFAQRPAMRQETRQMTPLDEALGRFMQDENCQDAYYELILNKISSSHSVRVKMMECCKARNRSHRWSLLQTANPT